MKEKNLFQLLCEFSLLWFSLHVVKLKIHENMWISNSNEKYEHYTHTHIHIYITRIKEKKRKWWEEQENGGRSKEGSRPGPGRMWATAQKSVVYQPVLGSRPYDPTSAFVRVVSLWVEYASYYSPQTPRFPSVDATTSRDVFDFPPSTANRQPIHNLTSRSPCLLPEGISRSLPPPTPVQGRPMRRRVVQRGGTQRLDNFSQKWIIAILSIFSGQFGQNTEK